MIQDKVCLEEVKTVENVYTDAPCYFLLAAEFMDEIHKIVRLDFVTVESGVRVIRSLPQAHLPRLKRVLVQGRLSHEMLLIQPEVPGLYVIHTAIADHGIYECSEIPTDPVCVHRDDAIPVDLSNFGPEEEVLLNMLTSLGHA